MRAAVADVTLPRLPAPAPGDHPVRDAIAVVLFVVAISSMGIAAFRPSAQAELADENRPISPWPHAVFSHAFAADFEQAFGDRFGGRMTLLRWRSRALVRALGVSPAPNVMIGRERWLFFRGEDGTAFDRFFRGVPPVREGEIRRVAGELARRAHFFAARNIAYVVTIAPDKATIYPDQLPRWAAAPKIPTPLDRLVAALRADGSVRFVDLRAPLRAAKASRRVYYATDSHWNYFGASVAYREIMRALGAMSSRMRPAAPVAYPPYVPGTDFYAGDLARMTGDPEYFRENDYAPLGKILASPEARCGKRVDTGADAGFERYACDRPELPRAVVYGDSMAIPLIPMLSENFSRVAYVSSHQPDPAFVAREKPDVVIEEMVERAMLAPAATPMPVERWCESARGV